MQQENEQQKHDRRCGRLVWKVAKEDFEFNNLRGSLHCMSDKEFYVSVEEKDRGGTIFSGHYKTKEKAKRAAADFVNDWEE